MTNILIEDEQTKIEIQEEIIETIKKVIEKTLQTENCDFDAEVSVTFVDNDIIRVINRENRNIDKATDVLSFPMLEFDENGDILDCDFDFADEEGDALLLGDIVISAERAMEQAENYGHSFLREMAFLTVHSMLHLLGYDHVDDPEGERIMIKKQNDVLDELGITRD